MEHSRHDGFVVAADARRWIAMNADSSGTRAVKRGGVGDNNDVVQRLFH